MSERLVTKQFDPAPPVKRDRNWMSHWLVRYGLVLAMFGVVVGAAILNSKYEAKINLTIPIVASLLYAGWYLGRGPGILLSLLYQATTAIYQPLPPGNFAVEVIKVAFSHISTLSLYLFLVLIMNGLKRLLHQLREHRDLLQVTLTSIGDGVITTDRDGRVTFLNPVAEDLTGWLHGTAAGHPLSEIFAVVNEDTGEPVQDPVRKVLETGSVVGLANHSILISRDGRQVPIEDSAAPIKDGGEIIGVVLVFSDVTERKLAESARRETEIMHRIVEAQESERHRIARDLHDHLGQRMTALRLKIGGFVQQVSSDRDLTMALDDLQRSSSQIDRDIGYLSWELRPTELDQLGLENALASFVREWSSQYDIDAEFHSHLDGHKGKLSKTVETNLYRIVQEGLNNVMKHADARTVSVLLQSQPDHLMLIIEDDGTGFVKAPSGQLTGPSHGLGLIGMRERASLLKGTLEIETAPGQGTTILARIPLDDEVLTQAAVESL